MFNRFGRTAIIVCLAIACAGVGHGSADSPQIREELKTVPPAPYDEGADAHAQVAEALLRAAKDHKFVLLDFGGNWCADCRVTAGVLGMSEVKPWVDRTFELVPIDVGRMKKNLDIAQRYDIQIKAVPTIIILDQNGRMVNSGNPAALKDARSMSPQAIVDTIRDWINNAG